MEIASRITALTKNASEKTLVLRLLFILADISRNLAKEILLQIVKSEILVFNNYIFY